uniref:Uncharacterized protein n=1 Tax=viral metagenome TaxID=1070528 RepID=A0A6M3JYH4_9ZZZZ
MTTKELVDTLVNTPPKARVFVRLHNPKNHRKIVDVDIVDIWSDDETVEIALADFKFED